MTALVRGDRQVPWRFDLPPGASVKPLKYEVAINANTLPETTDPNRALRYIDIGSVDSLGQISSMEEITFGTAPSRARRLPRAGDTLVSTVRTYLRAITFVEENDPALVCSTGFAVMSPGCRFEPSYLAYWMRSDPVVDEICARSTGVSYPAINASELGCLPIPLLPLPHQRSIASFLKEKTTAIDELIHRKQQLMELLLEKRRALISHVVTKGLTPDVALKESGLRLLGRVPTTWEVVGAKHVISFITSGSRGWSEHFADDGPLFLQTCNIDGRLGLDLDGVQHVHPPPGEGRRTRVKVDDVLVCITGALTGKVGVVRRDLGEAYVNQHIALVRTDRRRVHPVFLALFLSSIAGTNQFLAAQYGGTKQGSDYGGTKQGLGLQDLKDVRFGLPPRDEQDAIVTYVEAFMAHQEKIKTAMCAQIEALSAYRQALITEAVTGKLDVPKEVA